MSLLKKLVGLTIGAAAVGAAAYFLNRNEHTEEYEHIWGPEDEADAEDGTAETAEPADDASAEAEEAPAAPEETAAAPIEELPKRRPPLCRPPLEMTPPTPTPLSWVPWKSPRPRTASWTLPRLPTRLILVIGTNRAARADKKPQGASLVAKVRLFAILLPFSPSSRTQICTDFLFDALHLYCA